MVLQITPPHQAPPGPAHITHSLLFFNICLPTFQWLALGAAVALVLSAGAPAVDAARILVVIAMPAPSHMIAFTALTRALAERGHHITLVAPVRQGDKLVPTQNHELVSVLDDGVLERKRKDEGAGLRGSQESRIHTNNKSHSNIPSRAGQSIIKFMTGEKEFFLTAMISFMQWGPSLVRTALEHPNFKASINKPGLKFDLVITEAFFLQEAMVALGHKFDAPVVALNPFGTSPQVDDIMGNPVNPAWVPNPFLGLSDNMTFPERIISTL